MVTVPSMDGTQITSWRSGAGPALVLVHGSTADHTAWDAVRSQLESACTVCAMDRRGRGGSGDTPTYAAEREFEDVGRGRGPARRRGARGGPLVGPRNSLRAVA
jgi:pimeloyl-ACP methyl ester carboxylesterase